MPSTTHHGYAFIQIDDGEILRLGNRTHPFNHVHVFEGYVRSGRWANYTRFGARVAFRRHSNLRPYVQNLRHRGHRLDYGETYTRSWEGAVDYEGTLGSGPDGIAGSTLTNRSDGYGNFNRDFGRNYQLGNYSCAIGSMVISWNGSENGLVTAPNSVTGAWGSEALSEIDIPRNTIGNIFKHPYARNAWFNETLIIPLSQGQIQLTGAYNPPEERLHHSGFMVYYAKNGGTGTIQGAVKTTGATNSGTPARFTDTTFAGFSGADVGKYIAVHGQGIYLITGFVDASNVDTDAVTINESFTTQSGLTWTLRTGPIGEYFYRRRPYFKSDYWVNYVHGAYSLLAFAAMDERLCYDKTEWNRVPQRVVYDGYSHWWWTTPNQSNKPYGIMRHLHMSPQPFQDVLNDGSMTGLVQSTWGATAVGPTGQWEDIIVDQNRKLWFSASNGQDDRYVLARMHPAPGGNAAAPAVEAVWRKQQSASDAGGLTSRSIVALCDDRSGAYSGGPGTHRIWAVGGNNESTTGGLNYSDDDGATWKRVHALSALTGTATPTNASTAVVGTGTTFTTQLAAGDWIRFTGDTRSYEIASITDNLNMVLASNYLGAGGSPVAIQKGALAANQAICRTGYTFNNNNYRYSDGQHTIDWDTNGNVYWISHSGQICRWKPSDGECVSFAQTAIPAVAPLAAVTTGMPVSSLKVVRVPNVAGSGVHPFHNEVWLGFTNNGATPYTNGGWVRVRGDVAWTATPTAANFTRYHYNNSIVTSFPSIVKVPKDGTSEFSPYNTSIHVEPTTGKIILFASYGEGLPGWHHLRMTGAGAGFEYWRADQTMCYSPSRAAGTMEPWSRSGFDELGMGLGAVISAQESNVAAFDGEPPLAMHGTHWIDRRWNGSQWLKGLAAGNSWSDLNLRLDATNTASMSLGNGFRRMHEWSEPLDDGLYISFLQAGGSVAQVDEFLADETSTFICYIGAGKDNTQTANLFYQYFVQPTVQRICDEPVKIIKNMNTVDGGLEGGISTSNSGALTFRPPFTRGVADFFKSPVGYGSAPGYANTNNLTINSSVAVQPTAVLRVPATVHLDNDGFWSGGTDLFNSTSGYTFTAADIGKSIFIEGANGATTDPDNGQAVILSIPGGTGPQAQVDKIFTTTRVAAAGRRWKLKNIPVVSFVEIGMYNTRDTRTRVYWRHDLWSSKDHGNNWTAVKYSGEGSNSIPVNGPDDVSPGTWYTSFNGYKANPYVALANNDQLIGGSVIFDLRDLPENVRRRQYWRWRMYDPNNDGSDSSNFSGLHLYDANFRPLGRPAENRLDDADDDLFNGCQIDKWQLIRASGTGATPVDDGNADGLTNVVNVTGPLYTDTGTNDAQVTSAGRFIDPGAAFTRLSIGNYIRIGGAANSANNGWALITGFVSATEVQTSKVFVNETNTFTWATCPFGPNDELRIDSASKAPSRDQPLEDIYWTITDVPSTSQIVVQQTEVPHPITAAAWDVGRDVNRTTSHDSFFADWDTNNRVTVGHIEGTMHFGYDLEFVTVQNSTTSATTPADDDGDGCTDVIVMGENLTTLDGPVVGDYIEIAHSTYGRRMLEIIGITGADPNKNIQVAYDELLPGIASGLTWSIKRRRNLQHQVRRLTVIGSGAPVT